MFKVHITSTHLTKIFLLLILCVFFGSSTFAAAEAELADAKNNLATASKAAADAQLAKDAAQKIQEALAAQQASKPNPETERKLKDSEYAVMMANSKLSSANKAVERAQKKLDESQSEGKNVQQQSAVNEKPLNDQKNIAEKAKTQAASEENKKAEEALARKNEEARLAALKASEEARLAALKASEEARLAALKASEEAAKKSAEADAAAKKQALAAQLGIDANCIALPQTPTNPSTTVDPQLQAYAQGELNSITRLVDKKAADDAPPVSPFPSLEGSKLKPCEPEQKLALKFGYMGNGQYRLETPVLSGAQEFSVKGIGQALNRTIPESDNGETYVFFLDAREGREKLTCFKKSLLTQ